MGATQYKTQDNVYLNAPLIPGITGLVYSSEVAQIISISLGKTYRLKGVEQVKTGKKRV